MYKISSKKRAWCKSIALIPVFIAAFCVFSTKTIAQNDLNTLLTYESVENPVADNDRIITPEMEQLIETIVHVEVKRPSKQANVNNEKSVSDDRTTTPEMDVPKEKIPTVFEPNKDGKNELFLKGYDLQVFNRFGTLLFQGTTGWDGTSKGELMSEGVYYYIATRSENDGEKQTFTGFVTLNKQNSQNETKITHGKADCNLVAEGSTLEHNFPVRLNAVNPGEPTPIFKKAIAMRKGNRYRYTICTDEGSAGEAILQLYEKDELIRSTFNPETGSTQQYFDIDIDRSDVYTLLVTFKDGKEGSAVISIYHVARLEHIIELPTVFRPNSKVEPTDVISDNGNKNYLFYPSIISSVKEYSMKIFNRLGELLYQTNNQNSGWNGYFKGSLCNEGVYFYKIDGVFETGQSFAKMGDILVLR